MTHMPYELNNSGLNAWIYCQQTSIGRFSRYVAGGRLYKAQTNIMRIAETLSELAQEIEARAIFPCDEFACTVLSSIDGWPSNIAKILPLQRLIKTWIGLAPGLRQRSKSLDDVRPLGVRTPRQIIVDPKTTKATELEALGQPILIKNDNSCGGMGVSSSATADDAIKAAIDMHASNDAQPQDGIVVAQEFITGRSAAVSFSAFNGHILEAFSYRIIRRLPEPFGASSVIDIEHNPDLIAIVERIAAMYSYSGFGGIDFILPDDGGPPVFLEFNARQTRTTHLGRLVGADLCSAMASALTGTGYVATHGRGATMTVTLFPYEWLRDPHSPYLHLGHHDVPWHDPKIAAALMTATPPEPASAPPARGS